MYTEREQAQLIVPTGKSRPAAGRKGLAAYAVRAASVLLFLLIWHLLVHYNVLYPLQFGNLPKPLEILEAWRIDLTQAQYYKDIWMSTARVATGILLGLTLAVPLGLWIGLSRRASDVLFPNLELFRPIPLIAYLPVAMLLFPTIESSIIFITFVGAFFPILLCSRDAARRVSNTHVQAARILGCGPVRAIWKVYLPAMAPEIFTGLSVGVGASWMGVITGEMMSGQTGIGYETWQAYHLLDYDQSIIGMFSIGLLGYASSAFVRLIERAVIRWR
ncbi:ABC transporter permease [Paenibacillus sp. sptzw28]|uniref:ABC transporter permease n=1 Tax=Paenibacillus sp. sptzw28 TaxID=715179 RepID=UPI001C6E0CA9|nr:ABC transporter permease [Paenibacillus sp. sptzw28]QYR21350.1 ABC transporter permease [Paenibacillus sp. sptzw28]